MKAGVWTPDAQVLCYSCHGPVLQGGRGTIPADEFVKLCAVVEAPPEGRAPTVCDKCHGAIYVGEKVAHEHQLMFAINEATWEVAGVSARMDQTGGMCSAVRVTLPEDTYLLVVEDEESYPDSRFVASEYRLLPNGEEEWVRPADVQQALSAGDTVKLVAKIANRKKLAQKLAVSFSALLREALSGDELHTVVERNRTASPGVCHSHDFLDANEVMAEAFRATVGHAVGVSDEDCKLWGEAWDAAVRANFEVRA